jgi:type II secretory pathway pseudopilin PulG
MAINPRHTMKTLLARRSGWARRQGAFSLLEILLVTTIMTVIVFALYTMFDHTQRALRSNSTQVDIQETARATLDMISRDVEQCAASELGQNGSLGTNLFAQVCFPLNPSDALIQQLASNSLPRFRTNLLMDLFLLTRVSNRWTSVGYFFASATNPMANLASDGVASLYRFSPTNPPVARLSIAAVSNLVNQFTNRLFTCRTNAGVVADGIVHCRWQAYDPYGQPMLYGYPFTGYRLYPGYAVTNYTGRPLAPYNVALRLDRLERQTEFCFLSNALPAYIELELGVLEPQAWEKVKAMPTPDLKRQYLSRHAGQVHLFRKRIPIHLASHEP